MKKRHKPSKSLNSTPEYNLDRPELYLNRELSWINFNQRVLEEALDEHHPLLERVKFISIFGSNLDEFFMIRVSGLRDQLVQGVQETSPDGMTAAQQLLEIRRNLVGLINQQGDCWENDLKPKLAQTGIHILKQAELTGKERKHLREYFEREIFPVLTPLAFDPAHPFPHISNLSLNLAVVTKENKRTERFARLKVPDSLPRFLALPDAREDSDELKPLARRRVHRYVAIEEVIAHNLDLLFPGLKVVAAYPFRITRDADIEIEDDEASDLLTSIEEGIEQRQFGQAVRLEIDTTMPEHIRDILIKNLKLESYLVYTVNSVIGMADLMEITKLERPDLKDQPFTPGLPRFLSGKDDIFTLIRRRNILLYHPYDSFAPVVDFIRQAARDPDVLAIKQTLYRAGPNSPIFDALMDARGEGKQVAVLVELKARFDEETNITWARALEQEGVHVVYGLIGMKVHAKVCLVVRREKDGLIRYVHMSTGNYNTVTSRIYGDIGYFTADPVIGADVSDLFNALTGYSAKDDYRALLVAPGDMREGILARIEREIQRHKRYGDGYLAFKINALVDIPIIQALYRASRTGVRIDLQVRGICCLRPGLKGVSETITVTSVVGRFLEHARLFYFRNGGDDDLFLGSADLMPRNLDRRVEIMFPIPDEHLKADVVKHILMTHLGDTVKARRLQPDGGYVRLKAEHDHAPLDSQDWFLEHRGALVE
ncbi:MAG: polyphosphate kinase 1 [Syntrophaceae bacterium]